MLLEEGVGGLEAAEESEHPVLVGRAGKDPVYGALDRVGESWVVLGCDAGAHDSNEDLGDFLLHWGVGTVLNPDDLARWEPGDTLGYFLHEGDGHEGVSVLRSEELVAEDGRMEAALAGDDCGHVGAAYELVVGVLHCQGRVLVLNNDYYGHSKVIGSRIKAGRNAVLTVPQLRSDVLDLILRGEPKLLGDVGPVAVH